MAREHARSIATSADVAPGMPSWCMRLSKKFVFLVCLLQQVHHRLVCNLVVPEHARDVHGTILLLKEAMSSTVAAHMRALYRAQEAAMWDDRCAGRARGRCCRRT